MSYNEEIIRYPMRSNKEKPLFEYLVKTSMEFEYWLFDEYYDGYQAPFVVCKWKSDLKKLEELLKNTSLILWKIYKNAIPEE